MALTGSMVGVHMIPQLSVEGKKFTRPHTTCGHRQEEQEDNSDAGTYIIDDKTERQTRVKLESLERRLRANEKARKDLEEELEQWKARALKSEKTIPDLTTNLSELSKELEESKEAVLESQSRSRVQEESSRRNQEQADEAQKKLEEMSCHIASLLVEDQTELELIKHAPDEVFGKVKEFLLKLRSTEEENKLLMEHVRKTEERLEKSREHLERMGAEMQHLKKMDVERRDEQLQEIHLSHETSEDLKQNINRMEASASQYQLELELIRAEIRCVKSRNHELEQSSKNLTVLMRSADSERKAFLETLSTLLGQDDMDENGIKRAVRGLMSQLEALKTERLEQEKETKLKEDGLLNQAKQLRNALFRARTAESESSVITEKLQAAEQEVLATELELKALQKRVDELEAVIQQLGEMLDIQGESQLATLVRRVANLVQLEVTYASIFGEKTAANTILNIPDIRQIEMLRKRLKAAESQGVLGVRKTTDILDKQLLTKMTLDTLKAADSQKTVLKYKLSEQERRIRNLEREKRESQKLKDIVSKWGKKETVTMRPTETKTGLQSKCRPPKPSDQ